MPQKQFNRTKFFRVATEGVTTDGRAIAREWIDQMAASYDPAKYQARVNMEHIRGFSHEGPFKAYGDVIALEARDFDGGLRALYAEIDPTDDLVALTKARQKIFTSIEVQQNFAGTGQAYLVGLAVTDSPASLGLEVLSFAAQHPEANPFASRKKHPDNLFSAACETEIEFVAATPSLLERITALFTGGQRKAGDGVDAAVEEVARHSADLAGRVDRYSRDLEGLNRRLDDVTARVEQLSGDLGQYRTSTDGRLDGITTTLSTLPANTTPRPAAAGGGTVRTDC